MSPDNGHRKKLEMALNIERIDTRQPGAAQAIEALRAKLAPSGDVVSEAGRKKTIEVFGEPLVAGRSGSADLRRRAEARSRRRPRLHGQARWREADGRHIASAGD